MNLYRISQSENHNYDTYDSAAVAAPDPETARDMDPTNGLPIDWMTQDNYGYCCNWAVSRERVNVEYLGVASEWLQEGVLCASFNAG